MTDIWPKALHPAQGPMRADKIEGAALGMGEWGPAQNALIADGFLPPDMMTALTLFILGNQPRDPDKQQKIPGAGGGVAGGVWVRERYTIFKPLPCDDVFVVKGNALGRHVHKGRRYGTNSCATFDSAGVPVAENLTTGLLSYKVQAGLEDELEGISPDEVAAPQPGWAQAAANPHMDALQSMTQGMRLGGEAITMSLSLMEARDTKKPDNPIHSDPELAKKAGLSRPIAGGSHVLAFPLELIMQKAGRYALLHGANFDIRWKAPVYADSNMTPNVVVTGKTEDRIVFTVDVTLDSGDTAMVGAVTVPLAT